MPFRKNAVRQTRSALSGFTLDSLARVLILCGGLFIASCDSKSSAERPSVVLEDSVLSDVVVRGEFDSESDTLPSLSFSIAEDGVLDGWFFNPDATIEETPVEGLGGATSSIAFPILSLPASGDLTLRAEGSQFHYLPDADFNGLDSFSYTTPEGTDINVVINVLSIPDAPVFTLDISSVAEQGRHFFAQLTADDRDIDDELVYRVENMPDWLILDPVAGTLSGIPSQSDVGSISNLRFTVTDSTGLVDVIDDFTLEVVDINDAPVLNITQVPTELYSLDSVSFDVFPADLDNNDITITVGQHEAFESSVDGSLISLQMNDIERQYASQIVIIARDELGATTREAIPVELYPRTESGGGITVSGYGEGRGVHIVVLGDGYQADQLATFRRHVNDLLDNIRSDEGIADHLGALNIHMIETVSVDSGADDGETIDSSDTVFDSTYNCRNIARLVCADTLALYEVVLSEYADVDQIVLLVNDLRFGGSGNSGGRIAMTSAFYPEIALHEMGHSLADLADEYVDPQIQELDGSAGFEEGRFANVSTLSDPQQVPWSHWFGQIDNTAQLEDEEEVGVFEGGYYQSEGVYRPTFDSRMRSYTSSFGAINTEQWILRLYTLTQGFRHLSPDVENLSVAAGELLEFELDPIFGPHVQDINWSLDDEILMPSGNADLAPLTSTVTTATDFAANPATELELTSDVALSVSSNESMSRLKLALPAGQYELNVNVSDISGKIRVNPPHAGIFSWTWNIDVL